MPLGVCVAPGRFRAWAVALLLLAGCRASSPTDEAGVDLAPPLGWTPAAATAFAVPGTPLAAWTGPDGASLVVFRTLPVPGGSARGLAEDLANRLANLPGLRVEVRRVESVGGRDAARVEVVAPGTGDALAPSGTGVPADPAGRPLVPTRRICLGFPTASATVWLAWHLPEAARDRLAPQVEATLRGLRLRNIKPASSSY